MGACDSLIKKDIAANCGSVFTSGMESNGVVINRQDIDFAATVFDTTRKNIIQTLALKTGKKGYEVYCGGAKPFSGLKTSLSKGTYKNRFDNDVPLVVIDNDPDVAEDIIEGLANGEFVVILRNKHKAEDGKAEYQVYGYYQGLRAETIENDKYSEDVDGGWSIALKETGTPKAAMFYYKTSATVTATQFATLTSPAT